MTDPKFFIGLLFDTKKLFKQVADFYEGMWGKDHGQKKNDGNKIRVKCKNVKCKWFAYATKEPNSDAFVIWIIGLEHQCGRAFYHKLANLGFLSVHYKKFLQLNGKITVREFKEKWIKNWMCILQKIMFTRHLQRLRCGSK